MNVKLLWLFTYCDCFKLSQIISKKLNYKTFMMVECEILKVVLKFFWGTNKNNFFERQKMIIQIWCTKTYLNKFLHFTNIPWFFKNDHIYIYI